MKIGDRVTTQGFPQDYPLMILAIGGGRLAIGSPRWPVGANYPMDRDQITSVNGQPCQFPQVTPAKSKQTKRRQAA